MKIQFENLGCIEQGSVELNDLTIFCGKNNTGKTYAMYTLYGLLARKLAFNFDCAKQIVEQLTRLNSVAKLDFSYIANNNKREIIDKIEQTIQQYLPILFGVDKDKFTNTTIRLDFDFLTAENRGLPPKVNPIFSNLQRRAYFPETDYPDNFMQAIVSDLIAGIIMSEFSEISQHTTFILPAERSGLNLFYKELFSVRNLLLQTAQNNNINPMELLKDVISSRYPAPIQDYLQFLSKIDRIREHKGYYDEYAKIIQKDVLGGEYEVDEFGSVFFIDKSSNTRLPLHFSSSTVKTLFGLVFYLQHLSTVGDYLLIDEPELSLHPDNQRKVARVLAELVNAGLKVIVSTHSDYFVRELNNLIMLNSKFEGSVELQKKFDYEDSELLDKNRVSAYLFDKNTITPMAIDEEGIVAETFNNVINSMNKSSNEIHFAMINSRELED